VKRIAVQLRQLGQYKYAQEFADRLKRRRIVRENAKATRNRQVLKPLVMKHSLPPLLDVQKRTDLEGTRGKGQCLKGKK